ncbi:MAG: DUF935 family protein [Candidatus Dadabacteria bacterium]|nr:DUF935 family protein [Candidatus Dadabacteria bacterium]
MSKQGIIQKALRIFDRSNRYYAAHNGTFGKQIAQIATRDVSAATLTLLSSMTLPDPDPILKKAGRDITALRDLIADAHLYATVQSRKAGVLSLEWEIARSGAASPEGESEGEARRDQGRVEVIEGMFKRYDMGAVIGEILNAPLYGFQPLEVLWETDANGLRLPVRVIGKPPEWFTFDSENLMLFKTKRNPEGEPLPPFSFLVAAHDASYDNPFGEKVLSRCFWPVTFKRGGIKFWARFAEKFGMPFIVGKHPAAASQEEIDRMLDMMEKMVQDAVAAIPEGSDIDTLETSTRGSSTSTYEKFLGAMNSEISKAVLGQTLTTEVGDRGSLAAGRVHMDVRRDIIDGDRRIVEGVFNTLIKWVWTINFSNDLRAMPRFRMFERERVDKTQAERDEILSRAGVAFTDEYWKKTYGLGDGDIAPRVARG